MGQFINKLRYELDGWWDKAFIGVQEREDFALYFGNYLFTYFGYSF